MKTAQASSETLLERWKNFDVQTLKAEPSIEKEPTVLAFLERIDFFAKTTKNITDALKASGYLMKETAHTPQRVSLEVLKTTPMIGLALNSLDFIRIPMIYLACRMMGEEVPFTMKNNVKWALSGALCALGITGLLVPPIGGFIAIAIPALILTGSLITYKLVREQRKKDKKEASSIANKIIKAEAELKSTIKDMCLAQDPHLLNPLAEQKKNELKALYDAEERLKDSQSDFQKSDDAVSFLVPGMLTIGATLSFLAIPAAPFILIAGGLLGLGYMLARSVASKFNDFLKNKPNKEILDTDQKILDKPTEHSNSYVSMIRSKASQNIKNDTSSMMRMSQDTLKDVMEEPLLRPARVKVSSVIEPFETENIFDTLGETDINLGPRMRL